MKGIGKSFGACSKQQAEKCLYSGSQLMKSKSVMSMMTVVDMTIKAKPL